MVSELLKFKLAALLIESAALTLTLACGGDESTKPTSEIAAAVRDAIQTTQASQPSGPSSEELATQIQQSVQGVVQAIQGSQAYGRTASGADPKERGGSRRVGSSGSDCRRRPKRLRCVGEIGDGP